MKKSKKLARLKRVSVCGGCKYSHFVYSDDELMLCSRHHETPCCFSDPPCSHYVPFNDILCPRKTPFYWNDDAIPF